MKSKTAFLYRVSERLVVRPLESPDYTSWARAWSQLPHPKNVWDRKPRALRDVTRVKFRSMLANHRKLRRADKCYDLGIFDKSNCDLIGTISLMEVARNPVCFSYLGYGIFNPYWGQGLAKEAVKLVFDIGFKDLKLHRIEAGIEPGNTRSKRLAKSLKMRFEGCKRKSIYLREQWVDLQIYAITCEELGLPFLGKLPKLKPRI